MGLRGIVMKLLYVSDHVSQSLGQFFPKIQFLYKYFIYKYVML